MIRKVKNSNIMIVNSKNYENQGVKTDFIIKNTCV